MDESPRGYRPASCAGGRCDLGRVQEHKAEDGEGGEDNEGVCGPPEPPPCSCRRQGGAQPTDKMVRQTEKDGGREGKDDMRSAKDGDGTSNKGLDLG